MNISRFTPLPAFLALALVVLLGLPCHAQPASDSDSATDNDGRRGRRGFGNFDPEEFRKRMSAEFKDQFQVENDEEWALIYERIAKVQELRRAGGTGPGAGMGGFMAMRGRGGFGGGQGDGPGNRRGGAMGALSTPETEALATAIKNNSTPAEIKARLDRLREARKASEAKLTQAQEELRAVLNVRQEALAVLLGLLP